MFQQGHINLVETLRDEALRSPQHQRKVKVPRAELGQVAGLGNLKSANARLVNNVDFCVVFLST